MTRFLSLSTLVSLAFSAACRTKKYTGKDVCELLANRAIAGIMGEPFTPGSLTRLDDEDDEYIGSYCTYESEGRAPWDAKQPKFRVNVRVTYVEPEQMGNRSTPIFMK
jgi:hypothetical protein